MRNKIKWKVNLARDTAGTVEPQQAQSPRTWPKNKQQQQRQRQRNLLPIDPLIGPVNKNAVAEAARDREWLAPGAIDAGLAWLEAGSVAVELMLSPPRAVCMPLSLSLLLLLLLLLALHLPRFQNLVSCCFNTQINCPQILCLCPSYLSLPLLGWPLRYSTVFTLNFIDHSVQLATCCACVPLLSIASPFPAPVQPHCLARPFRLRAWSEIGFMPSLQKAPNCTHFLSTFLSLSFSLPHSLFPPPSAAVFLPPAQK